LEKAVSSNKNGVIKNHEVKLIQLKIATEFDKQTNPQKSNMKSSRIIPGSFKESMEFTIINK